MNNNFNEEFEDDIPIEGGIEELDQDEFCPMTDILLSAMMIDKPLGILWKNEIMEDFLIKRGYKIITRHSDVTGNDYKVAFKTSDSCIPETDVDNIRNVFNDEVQEILSNWLLKLGK